MHAIHLYINRPRAFQEIVPTNTKARCRENAPDPLAFAEPLSGSASYRFRIGDYRVIFEVLHGVGWVLATRRRDEAYRER